MRSPGLEIVAKAIILKTIIASGGATWRALGADNATAGPFDVAQITVANDTGATLTFGYAVAGDSAPTGETFPLVTGKTFTFRGLKRSNQLMALAAATQTFYAVGESN